MLSSGTRLGPYEIQSALGAGGMGAVYKARDTRLERTVAIKVLSAGPISTPELRQRFEREAKAISALNHPNICVLHDIGSQDGLDFLVMEYVDGETLSHRLRRGPLPMQQVLKMGVEVANALDKAHRAGLVHRDIKPANIMLTRTGAKLLDFGLAKPVGMQVASPASVSTVDPELTAMSSGQPLTQEGMIVGTYQYMAPEQIESGQADARTDLFALGCVLYEASTGRAAFAGKTQASVIASILASDPPPMTTIQPGTPALLERVVRTCLAKVPEDRMHSAHDLKLELEWLLDRDVDTQSISTARRRAVPWLALAATALVVAAAAIAGTAAFMQARHVPQVLRTTVDVGEGVKLPLVNSMALSPDGKMLAYVAQVGVEKPSLWIRPLDTARAKRVDDTDGAAYPFWSPDSRYVAFFVPGKLKKLDTAGWSVDNICDAEDGRGGTWNASGTIVFAPAPLGGLMKVSSSGGQPAQVTDAGANGSAYSAAQASLSVTHRWPQFLPDGKAVLFLTMRSNATEGELMKVDISTGKVTHIRRTPVNATYESGYLISVKNSSLIAEPVKGDSLALAGDAHVLAETVATDADRWAGDFTVSGDRLLVYRSSSGDDKVQLAWMDIETGKVGAAIGDPGPYSNPAISPDGTKIGMLVRNPRSETLTPSVLDISRNVLTPFLSTDARTRFTGAVWTPDSKSIVFSANLTDPSRQDLYIKPVDGSEPERKLVSMDSDVFPSLVTLDGKYLLFVKVGGKATRNDIWMLPLSGDQKPVPVLATKANETLIDVSTDDKWMLYTSDETGRSELYVTTFPVPHGRWQVSTNGAQGGGFEKSGKRLAEVDLDQKVYEISFDGSGAEPKLGRPQPVLGGASLSTFGGASITPDWKHMVVAQRLQTGTPKLTLVTNWTQELKK